MCLHGRKGCSAPVPLSPVSVTPQPASPASLSLLRGSSSFFSSLCSFSISEALRPAWSFACSASCLLWPLPDFPTDRLQLQNCPRCLTYISLPAVCTCQAPPGAASAFCLALWWWGGEVDSEALIASSPRSSPSGAGTLPTWRCVPGIIAPPRLGGWKFLTPPACKWCLVYRT